MNASREFFTTVAVTGVPSAHVASVRRVNVTVVGVWVHDFARYGSGSAVSGSSAMSVS
jgi:hypothetical protein